MGNLRHQLGLAGAHKPVCLGHLPDDFRGFWRDTFRGAEQGVAFLDVDAAQLAGPVIDVTEQCAVDVLQAVEIVGRGEEREGACGDFG